MNETKLNNLLALGFDKEVVRLKKNQCPGCGVDTAEMHFTDELSVREFQISGMCQKCQDLVFGDYDED